MFSAQGVEEMVPLAPGSTRDLVAARRAHRRAHGAPLHPGDLRRHRHTCPEPARDPLLPAPGAPALVLRGPADLGEAQGGSGDDAGRAARGAAQARSRTRWRPRCGGCACGRRASRSRAELEPEVAQADARCSPSCARCSGSTRWSRSTSARRRRRSRCSSSSTRWGSSWPSCGGCRRRAGSGPSTVPAQVKLGTVGPRLPGRGAEARRRRRGAVPRRVLDGRATATRRRRPPRRSTPTAGCTPVTSATIDDDGYLQDRRPQEGDHHQLGRQEHVAGEHRGRA